MRDRKIVTQRSNLKHVKLRQSACVQLWLITICFECFFACILIKVCEQVEVKLVHLLYSFINLRERCIKSVFQ